MSLVPSLLQAIVGLDGDALVIHVGEKPYVVAPSGQVELATRVLTLEAVAGIVEQLLPAETKQALDEFGAIQYEVPPQTQFRHEHFTVVAARGGDDVWVEIRRRRTADDDVVPADIFESPQPADAHDGASMHGDALEDADLALPESAQLWPQQAEAHSEQVPFAVNSSAAGNQSVPPGWDLPDSIEIDQPAPARPPKPVDVPKPSKVTRFAIPRAAPAPPVEPPRPPEPPAPVSFDPQTFEPEPEPAEPEPAPEPVEEPAPPEPPAPMPFLSPPVIRPPFEPPPQEPAPVVAPPEPPRPPTPPPIVASAPERPLAQPSDIELSQKEEDESRRWLEEAVASVSEPQPIGADVSDRDQPPYFDEPDMPEPARVAPYIEPPAAEPVAVASMDSEPEPQHSAVVLPISRVPLHGDALSSAPGQALSGLDRLLRLAATRGASTLYLASKARPSIRVNGEIQMLDEPALGPDDVESLLVDLMPDRNREAFRTGVGTEWISDIAEVGRVSCMSFRDHRGAGAIFRMTPLRAISAEQLGLSREVRALAAESEGLVLITGPRSSGKTTLLSAFVDLINRTRRVYVITIENDIRVVHDSRQSLISQREVRQDNDEMLTAARAAMREEPDVVVIEELRTADMIALALDAAAMGRLVIASVPAQTATGAIDRILELCPADHRRQVQLALAENLRGIVAQVLVRKPIGGQVAARELLLNTSAVASLIAEGKTSQIPPTMESSRKYGMVPLNDALVASVKNGEVDAREAYRRAADRAGFLALLKRQGIDTTFAERLA